MENVLIWLDDIRSPKEEKWSEYINQTFKLNDDTKIIWLKSYDDFVKYMGEARPLPKFISFDHDLGLNADGTESNGYDCARHLVNIMVNFQLRSIPEINVHSANPVGKENILSLFDNYRKRFLVED